MKTKLFALILALTMVATLMMACSEDKSPSDSDHDEDESSSDSNNNLLPSVIKNKKTFIAEDGKAYYLKDYPIAEGSLVEPIYATPCEYVYVDFDSDGEQELVINISNDYGSYLVLHTAGLDVFGFEFGVRGLQSLKADGSFMGSNGAGSNYYCRLSFEENKRNITYTAIKDSTAGIFELDGKECSIEELNEYINDWNLKKDVAWKTMKWDYTPSDTMPPSENQDNHLEQYVGIYHNYNWNGRESTLVLYFDGTCSYPSGHTGTWDVVDGNIVITLSNQNTHTAYWVTGGVILYSHFFEKMN